MRFLWWFIMVRIIALCLLLSLSGCASIFESILANWIGGAMGYLTANKIQKELDEHEEIIGK